ncbi:MAG: TlpA family protein disulfide reductase [Actinomycetes bacterium]
MLGHDDDSSSSLPPARFDRRTMLRAAVGAAALGTISVGAAGCGSEDTVSIGVPSTQLLAPLFPVDVPHIVAGTPVRLPFAVTSSKNVPLTIPQQQVVVGVEVDGEEVANSDTAPVRTDGVPFAYVPATLTFPAAGLYDVVATIDGVKLSTSVQVYDRDQVGPPQIGEPLPPVDTPTTAEALQVDPVCSRVPSCGMHATSLSALVGRGTPVALIHASPAFATSSKDRVMLDLLVEQVKTFPGVQFVHSEVYKNPKKVRKIPEAAPAPLADAYRLRYSPTLYITNAAGIVVARADAVVDRTELRDLLSRAV